MIIIIIVVMIMIIVIINCYDIYIYIYTHMYIHEDASPRALRGALEEAARRRLLHPEVLLYSIG